MKEQYTLTTRGDQKIYEKFVSGEVRNSVVEHVDGQNVINTSLSSLDREVNIILSAQNPEAGKLFSKDPRAIIRYNLPSPKENPITDYEITLIGRW